MTSLLEVLGDLMRGGSHSRRTVARMGVSLPTADRWLAKLEKTVPGLRRKRVGKTTWYEWRATRSMVRQVETRVSHPPIVPRP